MRRTPTMRLQTRVVDVTRFAATKESHQPGSETRCGVSALSRVARYVEGTRSPKSTAPVANPESRVVAAAS